MTNYNYELIICIVNAGFSSLAIDAAREAGATGGTIIHSRGAANAKALKTFELTINPEKDMLFIVVKSEIKDDVLNAIYKNAGLTTEARGIAFSLPVSHQVGIK